MEVIMNTGDFAIRFKTLTQSVTRGGKLSNVFAATTVNARAPVNVVLVRRDGVVYEFLTIYRTKAQTVLYKLPIYLTSYNHYITF